jgi:hypothetical protein
MDMPIKFHIVRVTGETEEQEISAPADNVHAIIQQMLGQYATVGMLRRSGDSFMLVTAHQIAQVTVEIPSIVIANAADTPKIIL